MVIWFPLRNVRSKCECAHTNASGHGIWLSGRTYTILYIVTNILTYLREARFALQMMLPNHLENYHSSFLNILAHGAACKCVVEVAKLCNKALGMAQWLVS